MVKDCSGCSACCFAPKIPELNKPFGQWCEHCTRPGCAIYSTRPKQCADFECAWLQSPDAADSLRPDKSRVLFERMDESVMFGSLLDDWEENSDAIARQIKYFNAEGLSVVINNIAEKEQAIYLADGHTRESVEARMKKFLGEL